MRSLSAKASSSVELEHVTGIEVDAVLGVFEVERVAEAREDDGGIGGLAEGHARLKAPEARPHGKLGRHAFSVEIDVREVLSGGRTEAEAQHRIRNPSLLVEDLGEQSAAQIAECHCRPR